MMKQQKRFLLSALILLLAAGLLAGCGNAKKGRLYKPVYR